MITTLIDLQDRFHIQYKKGKNLYEARFPVGDADACRSAVETLFEYVVSREIPEFSLLRLYEAVNSRMEHYNRNGG